MVQAIYSQVELVPRDETIRIVQLTDTHLKAYTGGTLLGLDTDHSLQAVIDLVKIECPEPDLLLGTGDLADSGAGDAYRRLMGYFDQITPEHYWLPGNHDLRDVMIDVAGPRRLPGEIRIGNWQIVMLDSQLPGEVGGHLGSAELQRLEQALSDADDAGLYSLICLHHQPVPIGCDWLDEQMVSDAQALFEIIGRLPPGARAALGSCAPGCRSALRGPAPVYARRRPACSFSRISRFCRGYARPGLPLAGTRPRRVPQ
jgi:Icc protein